MGVRATIFNKHAADGLNRALGFGGGSASAEPTSAAAVGNGSAGVYPEITIVARASKFDADYWRQKAAFDAEIARQQTRDQVVAAIASAAFFGPLLGAAELPAAGVATRGAESFAARTSGSAFSHSYTYDTRVLQRALEDPVSHNFPYSFDDQILGTMPVLKPNGYSLFREPGFMNGRIGNFEIGVTKDGFIDHRFFRPGP